MKKHKICIVGGGLTGLITALVLNGDELEIDLIFKQNKKNSEKDLRVTAISQNNFNFLKSSIKNLKESLFYSVNKIDLFYEKNKVLKNFLNFDDKKSLMYFFNNNELKSFLHSKLKKSNVNLINKTVKNVDASDSSILFDKSSKKYDLIILCLGYNSKLYDNIIGSREVKKNYNEHSVTTIVNHNIKNLPAIQFFLKEGPLAILPCKKNSFSVVWSMNNQSYFDNEKKISHYIKSKLQTVLKTKTLKLGKIQSYPLKFSIRKHYYKKDIIVLGDGLHVVHPLAGQGFNLILRDIKKLNDLISENTKLGLPINRSNIPKEFSSNRKPENLLMGLGIDATRIFFKPNQYVDNLKENILEKFAKSKTLKSFTKKVANFGIY